MHHATHRPDLLSAHSLHRTFITVSTSDGTGTLWERREGRAVEKSLVANYAAVPGIQNGWIFERLYQQPIAIEASSLQLACHRFLQSIGVIGPIKVHVGGAP